MSSMNEKQARHYVKRLRQFYISAVKYFCVNSALLALNLALDPHKLWFIWICLPWGITLLFKGSKLFIEQRWGEQWQERQVAHYMNRDDKESP